MNKEMIKLIQRELSKQTPIKLTTDGDAGTRTMNTLLFIEQIPTTWPKKRQLIGYIQYLCAAEGINAGPIDGYWGTQTEYGYDNLKIKLTTGKDPKPWRAEEGSGIGNVVGGNNWPLQTQEELEKYYGAVGTNQTTIKTPYRLRLAWDKAKGTTKITCHEKVADSLLRILNRVQDSYGDKLKPLGLDLYGGCLNVRKMRGGTNWSTHSWGVSLDWDSGRNKLRWGKDKANFAKPEYTKWWQLWEEEGWVSLGRTKNYDWMHVQAAKIRKK